MRNTRRPPALLAALALAGCSLALGGLAADDEPPAGGQTEQADDPQADEANGWVALLDGQTLDGWTKAEGFDYQDAGEVAVRDGALVLERGEPATGVRWNGEFPRTDFELQLEARRTDGSDFFCGLTFPVNDGDVTLILGGWGGWVVGLSMIDNRYAIDNETVRGVPFEQDQWYRVRVKVEGTQLEAWVDDQQILDFQTQDRELSASHEMRPCAPLGIATWRTTGEVRGLRYRSLP